MGRVWIEVRDSEGNVKEIRERVRAPGEGVLERLPDGRMEKVVPRWVRRDAMEALAAGDLAKVREILQTHPSYWLWEEVYRAAPPTLKRWITLRRQKWAP